MFEIPQSETWTFATHLMSKTGLKWLAKDFKGFFRQLFVFLLHELAKEEKKEPNQIIFACRTCTGMGKNVMSNLLIGSQHETAFCDPAVTFL